MHGCWTWPPERARWRSSSSGSTAARWSASTGARRCSPSREIASRPEGSATRIELREGRAETLPFSDGWFDALTVTYLLRYVDDPAATVSELARVVRPGGTMALLDFGVPPSRVARVLWELYVRMVLPTAGRLLSPGWHEVGRFLGPSIRGFEARLPLERQLELWTDAGLTDVRARRLSLGGGVVVWGRRR